MAINPDAPSTTNLPNPQSYEEILSDALSAYATKIGFDDFNPGSAVTSFFEVVALTTARASGDLFQILRDFSVDRATGDALQRLATENNITPITASPATGFVSVIDTNFQKISTAIYAGLPAPNVGTAIIAVGDASDFPSSGAVYIGRGTPNIEGPLSYTTPPAQVGTYWTITLSVPTTKFHNLGESVILAQGGNRSVPINSIVTAPAIGANPNISYNTTSSAIVLDGETTVNNVPITAQLPGSDSNVPIGAITQFATPPFTGATVSNPLAITTGTDNETDDQLRVRIKNALASIGLGTAFAVETAVNGAQCTTPVAATVTSTDLFEASYGAILYIDNGMGYEETSTGVGLESIVSSALGGEQFFQLACGGNQSSVAKAYLQSTLGVPFDLKGGDSLAVIVGGITYQHNFQTSDFRSPGAATAYEITASINGDPTLGFEGLTAGGGTYVVIRDKTEGKDSIQITTPVTAGRDAAVQMGLPASLIETLRLYKNQIPLSKDGNTASVLTQHQTLWSPSIADGDTLILAVDNTAPITYTITNAMFIATGLYTSVSSSNSLESWVEVFNNTLTGVTAEIVGSQIQITSNLGANNRAAVTIEAGSTLLSKGMFSTSVGLSSTGASSDYTLSRNTAQFELAVPLSAGDTLTAGSAETAARVISSKIATGSLTFSGPGYVWISIDNAAQVIPTGVIAGTALSVSKPSTNVVTYTSNVASAFLNVLVGDYVIVWSTDIASSNRLEGRVHAVTSTTLSVVVTDAEYAAATPVAGAAFNEGFVVIRCTEAPQKFEVTGLPQPSFPVTLTLDQIAVAMQAQTDEITFSTLLEEYIIITSNTLDTTGRLMVVTVDAAARSLNLPVGVEEVSTTSLIAEIDSQQSDAQMPLFIHSTIGAPGVVAYPPDTFLSSFTSAISLAGREPNELVSFLHPYGQIGDAQPYGDFVQETQVSGTAIGITENPTVRRLRGDSDSPTFDRYFLAAPLNFGHDDTAVAIVDGNYTSGSFTIPFFRVALTNTSVISNTNTFNATDTAAGGVPFSSATSFGPSFDFANFKVLMQAKNVLNPSPSDTAILYRSAVWGSSGQRIRVSYVYPSAGNSAIGSIVTNDEYINISINLASGAPIATSIAAGTQWTVSIAANTPSAGIDQVTYTWSGGPAPGLTLSGGEFVNIGPNSGFSASNIGVFKVSTAVGHTPTATSFSVQMPNGTASGAPVTTLVNGSITFYAASTTTANDVVAYVNANLSQYLTASLANFGVLNSGTGNIVLGTYEDSGFSTQYVQLMDGVNWIASSNIAGSPQFTLKSQLSLPTAYGYAFNNGESVIFSPTTMEQVSRFISVLAVTGFTTLGNVSLVDRGTRLQLSSQTLGSVGSIQIVGGLANEYQVPIFGSSSRIDNSIMTSSATLVAAAGVHSGQWFRLAATNTQAKLTLFGTNTSITLVGNTPTAGESEVQLLNRQLNQRYFGKPRYNVRPEGRAFRIEKQGSLVCLSANPGISTSPMFQTAVNFNDSAGGTVNVTQITGTSITQYAIASGAINFTGLSINDLVTIAGSGFNAANVGTFLVTGISDVAGGNGTILQVLNPYGFSQTGVSVVAGNFSATTQVSEGDTLIIGPSAGAHASFTGTITGTSTSVTITANTVGTIGNSVTLTGDGTSSITTLIANWNLANPSNTITLSSGNGAQVPSIGAIASLSGGIPNTSFNVLNQGQFRVIRRFDDSIWFENPNVVEEEVTMPHNPVNLGYDSTTQFTVSVTANTLYLSWNGIGTQPSLSNAQMGDLVTFATGFSSANQGTFMVVNSGTNYLECINPSAVTQSAFSVSDGSLIANRSQLLFYEYDATVPGDVVNITNNAFNTNNVGAWTVVQVLNRNSAIVRGGLTSVSNISLNGIVSSVYVEEGVPYYGYKQVLYAIPQPGTTSYTIMAFDTNLQYEKINQSALVQMVSLNKLDYNTLVKNGLDAYRYNTGLIQVANEIVYGNPRDTTTYPGVAAAGAEIFIRGPLIRRIQVSLAIRLNTGVPYAQTVQQVQNTVTSVVNSNDLGQPLAISSIVAAVGAIPGILSVAVSFPKYDVNDDLIVLATGEKALIIDPTTDVTVSQIGT